MNYEVQKRIIVMPIHKALKAHSIEDDIMYGTRVNKYNITSLEGLTLVQNFGNPFLTDDMAEKLNMDFGMDVDGYGGIKTVSNLFVEWIKGDKYQEIEPERREWLKEQIHEGRLDHTKFTYYRSCKRRVSHLTEMIKYIIEVRRRLRPYCYKNNDL